MTAMPSDLDYRALAHGMDEEVRRGVAQEREYNAWLHAFWVVVRFLRADPGHPHPLRAVFPDDGDSLDLLRDTPEGCWAEGGVRVLEDGRLVVERSP